MDDRFHQSSWQHLHLACEVHRASAHKRAFACCEGDISGQIHFSLALNFSVRMHQFGNWWLHTFGRDSSVRKGRPLRDALAFRRHVLRLCLSRLPHPTENGGGVAWWRCICQSMWSTNQNTSPQSTAIRDCVVGTRLSTYPRHNWTGADKAWPEFVSLDAVHRILTDVWPRYCGTPTRGCANCASERPCVSTTHKCSNCVCRRRSVEHLFAPLDLFTQMVPRSC